MFDFLPIFIIPYDNEENEEQQQEQSNDNQEEQSNDNQEQSNDNQEQQQEDQQKKYSQKEVNRLIEDRLKKSNQNRNDLVNQLKELRSTVKLTDKQREELEARIEQLQTETLSNQEIQKRDREKLVKEHDKEKKRLQSQVDDWRGRYTREKIDRELLDAAIENDAVSPTQIVNMLRPQTKLVEEIDKSTGQATGEWVGRTTINDVDEDGKKITLELSISDAISRFSEMNDNWNLFKRTASSGLGGYTNSNNRNLNGTKPPKDPKAYRQWRTANLGEKK